MSLGGILLRFRVMGMVRLVVEFQFLLWRWLSLLVKGIPRVEQVVVRFWCGVLKLAIVVLFLLFFFIAICGVVVVRRCW